MVYTDTQCRIVLTTYIEKRNERSLYPFQFVGIFLVGVFQTTECASRIYKVAGIDTYFVDYGSGG